MLELRKHFDLGSLVVIVVTFTLFVSAVFTVGLTHDVLLEAAVFLVSVKLIIMAYKQIDVTDSLNQKLDEIYRTVRAIEAHHLQENNENK